MTTDTYPKLATRTAEIGGVEVTINGFCKGAGMIAPDMATMLCYIFTDAAIAPGVLHDLVAEHARHEARHRVHHAHRRELAAGQHEVSD